jgi:hypothetical protein
MKKKKRDLSKFTQSTGIPLLNTQVFSSLKMCLFLSRSLSKRKVKIPSESQLKVDIVSSAKMKVFFLLWLSKWSL